MAPTSYRVGRLSISHWCTTKPFLNGATTSVLTKSHLAVPKGRTHNRMTHLLVTNSTDNIAWAVSHFHTITLNGISLFSAQHITEFQYGSLRVPERLPWRRKAHNCKRASVCTGVNHLVLKLMCYVPESSFRGQKCLTIIFSLTQSPPFLIEA